MIRNGGDDDEHTHELDRLLTLRIVSRKIDQSLLQQHAEHSRLGEHPGLLAAASYEYEAEVKAKVTYQMAAS